MNKIGRLIQDALKKERPAVMFDHLPSEEKFACFLAGLLSEEEKQAIIDYISVSEDDEDALRSFILLDKQSSGDMTEKAPEAIVEKVKRLMPELGLENALELVVEFAGNIARIIKNTGTLLIRTIERDVLPSIVFRNAEIEVAEEVEASKTVNGVLISIKIVKIKGNLCSIIVCIKDKKSGNPLSDERISMVHGGRELMSSLTVSGKVEFQNMKMRDYIVYLMRMEGLYCIASLSLRPAR